MDSLSSSGTFASCFPDLLEPGSVLSQTYPSLHQILQSRLAGALAARNHHPISRCDHRGFDGYDLGRSDGKMFQCEEDSTLIEILNPNRTDGANAQLGDLCEDLTKRVEVYGLIGSGTFAVVYLARDRAGDNVDPANIRHFAIKVQRHITLTGGYTDGYMEPMMVPIPDASSQRFIPPEALVLLLLTGCDRFPKLDSVYTHHRFTAIVMSPCVDPAPDRYPLHEDHVSRQFPAFTIRYLLTSDSKPLLDEMAACKVAAQILEGIVYMAQMNVWHNDLSVLNIIVDQGLDVTIIDLGDCVFGLEEEDFWENICGSLPFQEYQMSPELARELHRPNIVIHECSAHAYLPHDRRQEVLWKYGVLIYGILHGYWPWDTPPPQGHDVDLLDYQFVSEERIWDRRRRMLSEDVPIDPTLSPDCRDVLQALLAMDPAKRPSLETLTQFAWFRQWKYANHRFVRPFSWEFQESYTELVPSVDSSINHVAREVS
ncbi:uncharacterized protein N7459_003273 [Penicillium hispanicum]|uniref:uncharacterized protein n=1 Tax=Penicillium hispanicum TaxID=1080232 RepID=UPI00253F80D0|nr:uncharacterized protein N7459_003273 [Penicillium hispanicum]KAJ5587508.1 hypothetical protein N7459_003273 [Penicillium hispanicum]